MPVDKKKLRKKLAELHTIDREVREFFEVLINAF